MKSWYVKKAKHGVFPTGDTVLVLLPLPESALQAQCCGLYVIDHQVGECDHLVKTPDPKRRTCLSCESIETIF